jgi:TM2 domain-containing membrane protein YozV/DNA-directed RNA polymerase subunit RPC12/RpoP
MALIKCSKCGKDYSEELSKCPNCEEQMQIKERSNVLLNTMFCPHCGVEIPFGADFCTKCARPTKTGKAFCKHCGTQLNEEQMFCLKCGKTVEINVNTHKNENLSSQIQTPLGNQQGGVIINNNLGAYNNLGGFHGKVNNRSKIAAGILAILLGGVGVHKFYLGKTGMGILYLIFCWTLIPTIIAWIEGIIYLCMSDEDFDRKYNSY